jgi:hypothetical protein
MKMQDVQLQDQRESPFDSLVFFGTGEETTVLGRCSLCGHLVRDDHARYSIYRGGNYVSRRRYCPNCRAWTYFPAADSERVSEKPETKRLSVPRKYYLEQWIKYLPPFDPDEQVDQVETWCHKCGLLTKLCKTSNGGDTRIDHEPRFLVHVAGEPGI